MAGVAFPDAILGKVGDLLGAAMRAFHHAIGPAKFHHDHFAVLKIAEVDDRFLKSLDAVHETIMRLFVRYVKYIIALNRASKTIEIVDRKSTRLNSSHLVISYAV